VCAERIVSQHPSRRHFLGAVAAVAASQSLGATTTTTTSPTTMPIDDVAVLSRALGHDEYNAEEQQLMAEGLTERREYFKKLRQRMIDPRTEPAVQFNPRVPGVECPRGESAFTLSDAPLPDYNGDPATLAFATASDLSRLLHAGKVTSNELTKLSLNRLDTY